MTLKKTVLEPCHDRLSNKTLTSIRSKRVHAKPTDHDIGVSRHSDLASFSPGALDGESRSDHFSRLCLARARGGALCLPTSLALETTQQQLRVLQPTDRDLSVGNLLKESNTHRGAFLGQRRMNLLGEVDGL